MLLLETGRVVPVHRLVEAAWDDDPPHSAAHQIRKAVADLRQRIPGGNDLIVTSGPGYRAVLDEDRLDIGRFRAGVRQARVAVQADRRAEAVAALDSAVALWRGPLLAGSGGPVIEAASVALEEEYLAAMEYLFQLRLENGEAAAIISELRALVRLHPLRETMREQLMLALYRSGRQAEALEEYGQLRTFLAEKMGIDPGAKLAYLYEQILRQSPGLLVTSSPSGAPQPVAPASEAARPPQPGEEDTDRGIAVPPADAGQSIDWKALLPTNTLPYHPRDFSGREMELSWIAEAVERCPDDAIPIVAIDGMGGSGKTALVVQAVHRLADRYPDGQLFVDLRGFTPGHEPLSAFAAQETLLTAAGLSSGDIPSAPAGRTALWQTLTANRRLLLVLDNAIDAEQVRPLVPASPGCLTLITSRPRLVDLDGAEFLLLDPLSDKDGMALLRFTLGQERVDRAADAAQELLRLCGNLPLAVRIAAARLRNRPHWPIRRMVDRLRDETRRLAELNSAGRSVAVALRLSFGAMSEEQRAGFTLLGLHPGRDISVQESAQLLGVDPVEAEDFLESLVDARLLEERETGWYAFHDLVRSFAQHLVQPNGPRERDAITRLLDYYVLTAKRACDRLSPERPTYGETLPEGPMPPGFDTTAAALNWLDRHRDTLLAAVGLAHREGLFRHAACLPRELGFHSDLRNYAQDACRVLETGVAAARELNDPALLRMTLTNLAMQQWRLGRFQEGIVRLEEALHISREIGDRRSEVACTGRLGQFYRSIGQFDRALRMTRAAAQAERDMGLTREYGTSLNLLSTIHARLGDFEQAEQAAREALTLLSELGDVHNTPLALLRLATATARQKRYTEALDHLDRALELLERGGFPSYTAQFLAQRAEVLALSGQFTKAARSAEQALEQALQDGLPPRQAEVENSFGNVCRYIGRAEEALDHYQRALEVARECDWKFEAAQALAGLAAASEDLGRTQHSHDYRQQADALFTELRVTHAGQGDGPGIDPAGIRGQ